MAQTVKQVSVDLERRRTEEGNFRSMGRLIDVKCQECGLVFKAYVSERRRFCSDQCRVRGVAKMLDRVKIKKEELERLYYRQNLTLSEIAQKYGVSGYLILRRMRRYGLDREGCSSKRLHRVKLKPSFHLLSREKAYILGVLCGDGNLADADYRVTLGATDEDFVEAFKEAITAVYGLTRRIFKGKARVMKKNDKQYVCKPIYYYRVCSKKVWQDLKSYGDFRTHSWRVPQKIMNTKDEGIIASYLRGFFDSEGTVYFNPPATKLSAGTVNEIGMKDVSQLMNKIGIENRLGYSSSGEITVRVPRNSAGIFMAKVGFTINRKRQVLEAIVSDDSHFHKSLGRIVEYVSGDLDSASVVSLLRTYFKASRLKLENPEFYVSPSGVGYHLKSRTPMTVMENFLMRAILDTDPVRLTYSFKKFCLNPDEAYVDLVFSEKNDGVERRLPLEEILKPHEREVETINELLDKGENDEADGEVKKLAKEIEPEISKYKRKQYVGCIAFKTDEIREALEKVCGDIAERDSTFSWKMYPLWWPGWNWILAIFTDDKDKAWKRITWLKNRARSKDGKLILKDADTRLFIKERTST
jgi:hypothetical protein